MVLWLKQHPKLKVLLPALLVSVVFCYPYIVSSFLPIEHDTFFHLSRLEGLAHSIQDGTWIPSIYPYKNNYFGYASPLFYSDFFLLPFALLYVIGIPLSTTYKTLIFCSTFLTYCSMHVLIKRITKRNLVAMVVATAYVFANYRISDVYVRGALGETVAFVFAPILLLGIYELFYEQNSRGGRYITIGLSCLVLTHNLSFLLYLGIFIIFAMFAFMTLPKELLRVVVRSCLLAFLLTCFFTLPMLEQLHAQEYYLDIYATNSALQDYIMPFWKYFANTTIFGYGNANYAQDKSMLVNIGYALTFLPLVYLFIPREKKNRFTTICFLLGYITFLLPSTIFPWEHFTILRVLQFPWRLNMVSMLLLSIPFAVSVSTYATNKYIPTVLLIVLLCEGIFHVNPVLSRTFGITNTTSYASLLDGSIIDPYYSATYVRVECAGGDYLPLTSVNYQTYGSHVEDSEGTVLDIPLTKQGTTTSFTLSDTDCNHTIILPITWYKGYQVYHLANQQKEKVLTTPSSHALVSFQATQSGSYQCSYTTTPIQHGSRILSLGTLLYCLYRLMAKKTTKTI